MIKYSEATKREALETYQREGIKAACERFHVPSSSIYRRRNIENREALLAQVAQENNDTDAMESKEENSTEESIDAATPNMAEAAGTSASEEDVPDMVTLLMAENEKLRAMNLQLRKALQMFVM